MGNGVIGEWSKCGTVVKMAKCCKLSTARVVVGGKDGKAHILTMFNDVVNIVIDGVSGW